jgi:cysteinyl-tRNA synthetase
MRIYNTLTRTKETFVPLTPGQVRMYVCGVTVYDLSHIGHARSAIVFDVIRRWLTASGYAVTFVKNYTDIEDKIIRRANDEGVAAREVSERYVLAYDADMTTLRVLPPDVAPKATDHVGEMVELIGRLIELGVAYVVDGDVYFEVRRFPAYGRLSGKALDELLAGARVDVDERKRDPRDFALWKSAKPGEPVWDSPWSPGRPGWHIECSAMAMRYLGESFDIHGGGEDLVFPHHECEIAQSEAATGKPFARTWMHNAFVNMGAEKMSKSLGNVFSIREVVQHYDADVVRLWLLGAHYRSPIDYVEDRLKESARALERLRRLFRDVPRPPGPRPPLPEDLKGFRTRFAEAMDDDFNTPQARAVLFDFTSALYERRDRGVAAVGGEAGLIAGVAELEALGQILGLFEGPQTASGPPAEVTALADARNQARQGRDWRRADELREAIQQLGWSVEDTPGGARLTPRSG